MKRLLSGIQPSGNITLGNYLGAIRNFVKLQDELTDHEFIIFIADLHAITVHQDKNKLRQNIINLAAIYLACGLKRERIHLFIQSEVPAHNQLDFILECVGNMGEFERMTQYKDKKRKEQNPSVGLFTYPALMAADILLYDADVVPIGDDQKQHLELTRDLAIRFNQRFGDTFIVPEPLIAEKGSRIMALADPTKKMSKSDENPKNYILLLDDIAVIRNKIRAAVTDSDGKIYFDEENKPGISNLMTIYSLLTDLNYDDITKLYKDKGYGEFKEDLAKIVCDHIQIIQDKYNEIIKSPQLQNILDDGAAYANIIAQKKIQKIYHKIGLGRKK